MIQQTYTTRVLVPELGNYITQAEDVEPNERVFSKKVFLGINDDPSNWKEITEDEAEAIKALQTKE